MGPLEVTKFRTLRSAPAPSVVIELVPDEVQDPVIVKEPWFVTDALKALRPVTLSRPVLFRLRSPKLVPLKFEIALGPVSSVLPLVLVFSVPAITVPSAASLMLAAFSVT